MCTNFLALKKMIQKMKDIVREKSPSTVPNSQQDFTFSHGFSQSHYASKDFPFELDIIIIQWKRYVCSTDPFHTFGHLQRLHA